MEGASQTSNSNTTSTINTVSDSINNMNISNNNTATNNDDNTLEVTEQLQNMRVADNNVSICANCGKEGANNVCNKCKQVKYCNAVCKKVHKKKHKKDCEEHIRLAAEKHDEELFKQPPPTDKDCPICFIRLPILTSGYRYMVCCGTIICSGCEHAPVYDNQGNEVDSEKCPFCRTPWPDTDEEMRKRLNERMEAGDAEAIYNMGCYFYNGRYGFQQDYTKALELWRRAGDLGYPPAYVNIGYAYGNGISPLEVDKEKEIHYYELAAMAGNEVARNHLGVYEEDEGNMDRALKHHMIAVRDGYYDSLERTKNLYSKGFATKGDYMIALLSYQEYLSEIKSRQRDEAAAADKKYRYY